METDTRKLLTKWQATGLLQEISSEEKMIKTASELENNAIMVVNGSRDYNWFESQIVEMRDRGAFKDDQ